MSDETSDIPPALTAEQWAKREWRRGKSNVFVIRQASGDPAMLWVAGLGGPPVEVKAGEEFAALIALTNAAMNDEDPRKLAREKVDALRELAAEIGLGAEIDPGTAMDLLHDLADVIESYLPPVK